VYGFGFGREEDVKILQITGSFTDTFEVAIGSVVGVEVKITSVTLFAGEE
jgi:hypothetical protein